MNTQGIEKEKIEAKESAIREFISAYHSGGELTAKDRSCLGRLLGLADYCKRLRGQIEQTTQQLFDGAAMIAKSKAEHSRLMESGLLTAAAAAMERNPQITDELKTLRGQLESLIGELNKAKETMADLSGLRQVRAEYQTAAAAIQQRGAVLRLLEKADFNNEIEIDGYIILAESLAKEIDKKIKKYLLTE